MRLRRVNVDDTTSVTDLENVSGPSLVSGPRPAPTACAVVLPLFCSAVVWAREATLVSSLWVVSVDSDSSSRFSVWVSRSPGKTFSRLATSARS